MTTVRLHWSWLLVITPAVLMAAFIAAVCIVG